MENIPFVLIVRLWLMCVHVRVYVCAHACITGNRALKYGANGARINSQTGSVVGTAAFIVTKKFQIDRHYF